MKSLSVWCRTQERAETGAIFIVSAKYCETQTSYQASNRPLCIILLVYCLPESSSLALVRTSFQSGEYF